MSIRYDTEDRIENTWLTVPNILCEIRFVGTFVLLYLAYAGHSLAFATLLAFLLLTDWLDGKLAHFLNQRTRLGAVLDSIADGTLYASLIVSAYWLRPEFFRSDWPYMLAVVATYLVSSGAGLMKFRRLPSYHTLSAKACWTVAAAAALVLFFGGPVWPARIAIGLAILTNLEGIVITAALKEWRPDIPTSFHAFSKREEA